MSLIRKSKGLSTELKKQKVENYNTDQYAKEILNNNISKASKIIAEAQQKALEIKTEAISIAQGLVDKGVKMANDTGLEVGSDIVLEASKKAKIILDDAKEEANNILKKAIEEAHKETKKIKEEAKYELEDEVRKIRTLLNNQLSVLGVSLINNLTITPPKEEPVPLPVEPVVKPYVGGIKRVTG